MRFAPAIVEDLDGQLAAMHFANTVDEEIGIGELLASTSRNDNAKGGQRRSLGCIADIGKMLVQRGLRMKLDTVSFKSVHCTDNKSGVGIPNKAML